MFNIEVCFISKLLETKDMITIKDNQIKPSYFTGINKSAFIFIYDTFMSTGEVPTARVFLRKFPEYHLETVNGEVGTSENLKFWCDELRKKVKHNSIASLIENAADLLNSFETEKAYTDIKKRISYIENEIVETNDVDITKDSEDRVKAYLDRKINRGMKGIPTGFKKLDYLLKGLENKTLTTIIAQTGIGKTWFVILLGAYCMLNGYKVLQFVTEMSEDIMRDRYEAVLFSMCYGELNYQKFKSGNLDYKTEQTFIEFLRKDLPSFEPLYISTATSVMGVSATIEKYEPDVVFIDSAYLMEDDQNAKEDWLRITHITRDLKKLAKRVNIPLVINTQADKNTSKKTGPELGSIMYSQSVGQDSDNVLALYRDDVMKKENEMGLSILKQREGTLGKVTLSWDFDRMKFNDLYLEEEKQQTPIEKYNDDEDGTLDVL